MIAAAASSALRSRTSRVPLVSLLLLGMVALYCTCAGCDWCESIARRLTRCTCVRPVCSFVAAQALMHPDDDTDLAERKQRDKQELEHLIQANRPADVLDTDAPPAAAAAATASANGAAQQARHAPTTITAGATSSTTRLAPVDAASDSKSLQEQIAQDAALRKEQAAATREEQLRLSKWDETKMALYEEANNHRLGNNTSVDIERAIRLYKEAADANNDNAMLALGEIYEVRPSSLLARAPQQANASTLSLSLVSLAKESTSTLRLPSTTTIARRRWGTQRRNVLSPSCTIPAKECRPTRRWRFCTIRSRRATLIPRPVTCWPTSTSTASTCTSRAC